MVRGSRVTNWPTFNTWSRMKMGNSCGWKSNYWNLDRILCSICEFLGINFNFFIHALFKSYVNSPPTPQKWEQTNRLLWCIISCQNWRIFYVAPRRKVDRTSVNILLIIFHFSNCLTITISFRLFEFEVLLIKPHRMDRTLGRKKIQISWKISFEKRKAMSS